MGQVRYREKEEVTPDRNSLLELAAARLAEGDTPVTLDERRLWLKYATDADVLTIRFKETPRPSRSHGDVANGVIYNYEGSHLVSIEILDITGAFVDAA